ncbi:E3 ubiquitin-protein ligase TRIM39-like [Symphorus nematophorus]
MASASDHPCEEEFLCSICLHAFSEPVSTPCGHNYCKMCITGYWTSSGETQCPLCKRKFRNRPQLQVNTEFRDMVVRFNNLRVRSQDDVLAKPGEVTCDVCLGPKLKAQKTCLVCLASYCQPHLERHQTVPTLQKHQLIEPVSNLEDRICKKHGKLLELFCFVDLKCICFMCWKEHHAGHDAVPLEQAFRERKARLVLCDVPSEIKMIENSKSRSIEEIKHSIEQRKKESEKEIADIAEVFTALVVLLQRSQAELIELIQEKQKAAEKQAEDLVTQLEQEVVELRRRGSEVEQLLQTEDHLHFLQGYRYIPARFGDLFDPLPDIGGQSYVGMVKKAIAQMEKTLNNEMEMLFHEVRLSDGCEAAAQSDAAENLMRDEFIKEVWSPPQDKLMMIQQCHAVDVTLDAYTAYSRLMVSDDGKQLRSHEGQLLFPGLFRRGFEHIPFVLGKEGFSSGKFYFEVQISGSKSCVLGVAKESIKREMFCFPMPAQGAWTFSKLINRFQEEFRGLFVDLPLNLRQRPQTVGVFVDYEKGEVSFYDVDARSLLYSYTGCTFTETTPALKAFLYSMAGTPLSSRPKLYPILGIYDDDGVLVITPVARAT